MKPATIRNILSLASSNQQAIHQLGVKNAFLPRLLHKDVYMKKQREEWLNGFAQALGISFNTLHLSFLLQALIAAESTAPCSFQAASQNDSS